jgi:hypothetical protein
LRFSNLVDEFTRNVGEIMIESNNQYWLSRVRGCWVRRRAKAKCAAASSALSVLSAMALQSAPATAEEYAGTQSVEILGTLGIGWRF